MRSRTDRFYKHNPNCAAVAYVMGGLTGTLCSLTKAFLFRSISSEHPERLSIVRGGSKQGAEGRVSITPEQLE